MARMLSQQFLGTYIDAVYHTSIIYNGIEYFYGLGIQRAYPGSTHHGQPMRKMLLGQTELPMDVVTEWFDDVEERYSTETYDLFVHNCNTFSNDFAEFLVGKGIPDYITSLPETILNTPFGQLLRPQLDSAMRSITQAPVVAPAPSHAAVAASSSSGSEAQDAQNREKGGAPKSPKATKKHDDAPM